jgi:hypothetical protein
VVPLVADAVEPAAVPQRVVDVVQRHPRPRSSDPQAAEVS